MSPFCRAKPPAFFSTTPRLSLLGTRLLTLSSVEGSKHPPLEYRTLPNYFREEIVGKYAEKPALICRQEPPRTHGGPPSGNMNRSHLAWDFYAFDRHILATARGLIALGVKKGDRVGVVMGNNRCESLSAIVVARLSDLFYKCICIIAMGVCQHRSHLGHP